MTPARLGLLVVATAATASVQSAKAASQFYCLQEATLGWDGTRPVSIEDATTEFWLDAASGEWTERVVGGRAGVTGGGRLAVVNDGRGHRHDWVGVDLRDGETLRLRIATEPHLFVHVRRNMMVATGTCVVDDGTKTYIDGQLVEERSSAP